MPLTTKYSAVGTKIRALAGNLLKPDDYLELSRKSSVAEVAGYLKYHSAYGSVLKPVNEQQIHRGQLEKLVRSVLFGEIRKLTYFLDSDTKKYIHTQDVKYEIEFIKGCLRRLFYAEQESVLPDLTFSRSLFPKLDVEGLYAAKSFSQFLERLRGTKYHTILTHYAQQPASLFQLETALDVYFIETAMKMKEKYLKGRDLEFARESIGIYTDLSNLLAVVRSGTYFRSGEQMVYSMIVPQFYKMSREELLNLIRAKSEAERETLLKASFYKDVFSYKTHGFYDHNVKEYLYQFYRRGVKDPGSIGVVISYIRLKEIEVSNIVSIIEGIRYQLSPEEIQSYLIGNGDSRRS